MVTSARQPRAVIVGAGLGGLATSIRLAAGGYAVTVMEKNSRVGGRCNILRRDAYTFDTGPTLLLMRDAVEELFSSVDRNLSDYLDLVRMDPNYDIHFGDGTRLRVSPDREAMEEAIDTLSPGSVPGFRRYVNDAQYKYRVARERFVERNFLRLRDFVTLANLKELIATNTLRMLDVHARRYFTDERLQAAFTFQTMYLGLPPSRAPAVYSLLPYTELAEGIWFPMGGMYQLAAGLARLATELGVQIHTDVAVDSIAVRDRQALGVVSAGGLIEAEVVVSNADLPYSYRSLLPKGSSGRLLSKRLNHLNHGSSAYLLFAGAKGYYDDHPHHSVYLSADIGANYRAVFQERRLPEDPSAYVCLASRTDPSLAPEGRTGVYVLVPVPSTTPNIEWSHEEPAFRQTVLDRLARQGLPGLNSPQFVEVMTPHDLASLYNLLGGSGFGLAHTFLQVGYMRPSNRAAGLSNVYFCGASTAPGGGVPMVIIGSRLTAERIFLEQRP